jgi:hypothetical protein
MVLKFHFYIPTRMEIKDSTDICLLKFKVAVFTFVKRQKQVDKQNVLYMYKGISRILTEE